MFAKLRCGAGGASADAGHWPHLYGTVPVVRKELAVRLRAHSARDSLHVSDREIGRARDRVDDCVQVLFYSQ